jgi:hypothetical protein
MTEIERRVRNGQVRWVARYFDPDGRRRGKVFDRKVDAQRFQAQVETSKITGNYVDPARGKIATGPMADKWLETQGHLKPSTYARYAGIVEKWIKPRWGTHEDVAAWISSIRLSPASVAYIHRVLSLILELAVRSGRISRNPAHGVRLPKDTKTEKRFLTAEEVFRAGRRGSRVSDSRGRRPVPPPTARACVLRSALG